MQRERNFLRSKWMIWAPALAALLLSGILVPAARAGKFHFNSALSFSLGGSLVATGTMYGVGNQTAEVTLTGYGTVTALCQNKGGNQAPGRNPIKVSVEQSDTVFTDENGRASLELHAPDPTAPEFEPSPTPKQAGCPNGKWTVVGIIDGSTNWTGANLVVKDESGKIQIDQDYTCTTTFTNGVGTAVSCVES
jgi:hypothetical protein